MSGSLLRALFRGAEQRHLRIDDEFVRRSLHREVERSFGTGGDDGAEVDRVSRAVAGVDGNAGDEGARDAGLKEFAADDVSFVGMVRGKFHAIVWDACAAYPLLEKPFHAAATFEIHCRSHDSLNFVLQIVRGERAVGVLR